jgi:hypothetical protein
MSREGARGAADMDHVLRIIGGFALVGLFLFFHVWWPIQAERNLKAVKRLETQVAQKKAELNQLNARYGALTALTVLDQWAKSHGPWRSPTPNDIITIQQ